MPDELEAYESNTLAFRVKIWVEERADGKTKAKWRGYIVHVPTEEKEHYFSDFFEIDLYILSYLIKIGIRSSWFWQIVSWYKSKRNRKSNSLHAGKEKT